MGVMCIKKVLRVESFGWQVSFGLNIENVIIVKISCFDVLS